jgi:protein O-mannosyl-transferase
MDRTRVGRQIRRQAARKRAKLIPEKTGLTAKSRTIGLCVLLAVSTFALYLPALSHSFVNFDDQYYVTQNAHVQAGLTWGTVKWAFSTTRAANWHPLTWISHAVDCQLFGLNPAGHHFDSMLLHVLNSVLLFLLLQLATELTGPSLLVAALFAFHPLNVESVAWIAERKNVLCTFFFLAAIGAYGWYARKPELRRYLLVVLLFALGLMAKPMVITLPCVLLLLDYWPLSRFPGSAATPLVVPQRPVWTLVAEKIPLLLLSAVSAVITMKAQALSERTLNDFSLPVRVENALVAYAQYLWNMVWPTRLAAFYPHPGRNLHAWQIILSAVLLAAISGFAISFRARRYLLAGWLWFLGTLVPVIGLVQVGSSVRADRYAYIPLIGIFAMIAFGAQEVAQRKNLGVTSRVIPALCVLGMLGFISSRQLACWSSQYDLWAHAVQVTDMNSFAHNALGQALLAPEKSMSEADLENFDTPQKRMQQARWHFEQALQICRELERQDPSIYRGWFANNLNYLGYLDLEEDRSEEARQEYTEALNIQRSLAQKDPGQLASAAETLDNLGYLDRFEKHPDDAREHFSESLETYRQLRGERAEQYLPEMATTLNELAVTEVELQQPDQARQHFLETLELNRQFAQTEPTLFLPAIATTLYYLGNLERDQKEFDPARQHYDEASRLYRDFAQRDPHNFSWLLADILNNLGLVEKALHQNQAARGHYQEALGIYRDLSKRDPRRFTLLMQQVEVELAQIDTPPPVK